MSTGAWLEIDLLRQRRERYGTQRPAVINVRTLLMRGSLLGSALPLLLLIGCIWLYFTESRLSQRAAELQPLADEHDLLQEVKIPAEKQVLKAAVETNQSMGRAIANVRSSSVLLAELRRLVPHTIMLEQARISDSDLELSGESLMPDGLRTLNALMLSLGQSALFDLDGVRLQQATLKGVALGEPVDQERIDYVLTAQFASDASQAIRPQLTALGAVGLERRLQRLDKEEGLFQ